MKDKQLLGFLVNVLVVTFSVWNSFCFWNLDFYFPWRFFYSIACKVM